MSEHILTLARIKEHLSVDDDLTLITLKGHLLVEEFLDTVIESYCADKEALKDAEIGFRIKLKLAQALTGYKDMQPAWTMAERLNSLRNALAHKLEHPMAQKRLQSFFNAFRSPDLGFKFSGNAEIDLPEAIAFLLGYVWGATGIANPRVTVKTATL